MVKKLTGKERVPNQMSFARMQHFRGEVGHAVGRLIG